MAKLDDDIKKTRRALESINKSYAADLEKLMKQKSSADEIAQTEASWSGERQREEYILDALLTQKLKGRAEELDMPLPHYPVYGKDGPDGDENEHWYHNPMDGSFTLSQRGSLGSGVHKISGSS